MKKKAECIEEVTAPPYQPFHEEKSILNIINKESKKYLRVRVDNCLIGKKYKKCDWILDIEDKKKAYFIELKGSNIDHACAQLKNSREMTESIYGEYDREFLAIISNMPAAAPYIMEAKKQFREDTGFQLNVMETEESLEI